MECRLRPASESDREFLYALHCATMRELIDKTWGWDDAWQRSDFDKRWRERVVSVIEVDGYAAGALWLESRPDSIYVADLQVLPALQRRGIGTAVLQKVIAQGTARGLPVTLSVLEANPNARRLYERLGFEVVKEESPAVHMWRRADARWTVPEAPVEIVSYDPSWPRQFEEERHVLSRALAPWLAGSVEHIGSTAVPGLAAKPVIDIMAGVRSLDASRAAIGALTELGYCYAPYRPAFEHWFCKPSPAFRTHHLHLVPVGSRQWDETIAFRDYLRAHPAIAAEYADLKQHLAREHRFDREAYTVAKGPFIGRIAALAMQQLQGGG